MEKLVNLEIYSPLELILFTICCLLWAVVYIIVIVNIHKHKVVEIPVAAVCANVAWELWWGWGYHTNMGELFQWGYRIWFFLDVYIVYCVFKYGNKQVLSEALKKYYVPAVIMGLLFWIIALYFLIPDHDTDKFGAFSGYVLSVYMGALYCFQIVKQPHFGISYVTAWLKMIGTGACSVMCYIHFWGVSGFGSLLSLCAITLFLDCLYIYLAYKRPKFHS
jgi:hypothetical protein